MRNAIAMMVKVSGVVLLALALVAFISACGGSSIGSDGADGSDVAEVAEHAEGDEQDEDAEMFMDPVGEERVIDMLTKEFKFVPDTITIKVGETVRLKLENLDPVLHDFTTDEAEFIILETSGASHGDHDVVAVAGSGEDGDAVPSHDDDQDMDSEAQVRLQPLHIAAEGDDNGELVFKATKAGEYVFYCSVPGHRETGMVGTIIIEE